MNFEELYNLKKQRYGEKFDNKYILRIHRAISWGKAAENTTQPDEQFIFYWISLNSLYADCNAKGEGERSLRRAFFEKISTYDTDNRIQNALIENLQNQLRLFVDNEFLYDDFWKAEMGEITVEQFARTKKSMFQRTYKGLMAREDAVELLDCLFSLMAVLRNQIFHGLATYNSSANKAQKELGVKIMQELVPIMCEIVVMNDQEDWGGVAYPFIKK